MSECQQFGNHVKAYTGDSVDVMRTLPADYFHCAVTSPPYFGLRDYKVDGQIGLEKSPAEYVQRMVEVCREVKRTLRPDGVFWLNIGDSYSSGGRTSRDITSHNKGNVGAAQPNRPADSAKPKDLLGIPWRLAFALQEDGWWLRSAAPWVKRNAMPESTRDRPGSSLEYVFQLTKSPNYFYDTEPVKREAVTRDSRKPYGSTGAWELDGRDKYETGAGKKTERDPSKRNRRNGDWWFESVGMLLSDDGEVLGFDVVPKPYKGAHFACFPPNLIRPCILSSTSEGGCCSVCGKPQRRVVHKDRVATRPGVETKVTGDVTTDGNRDPQRHVTTTKTIGWNFDCKCIPTTAVPCRVLDPFGGSGTTGMVCEELERECTLIELNPEYVKLQRERVSKVTLT